MTPEMPVKLPARRRVRRRGLMTILIILLIAGGLTACGRKGALEPPQSAVTTPGAFPIS